MDQAGIDVVHVPYKGTSPALTDTIAGNTQIVFGTVASTIPHVRAASCALAVSTPKRLPALPMCRPRWSLATRTIKSSTGTV